MRSHDAAEPISPYLLSHIRVLSSISILFLPHLASLPLVRSALRPVKVLISDFLPIDDFISPDPPTTNEKQAIRAHGPRLWRQIVLVLAGLIEAVAWLAVWGMTIMRAAEGEESVVDVLSACGMAAVWLYLFIKPLFRPPSTPPWSETLVYAILWVITFSNVVLALFLYSSNSHWPVWASPTWLAFESVNFGITSLLIYVVGGLPLASPEAFARVKMAPDDRVTLLSWLSFSWIDSFIRFGNTKELEPEDLPDLSPTMQTAYLFERFSQLKGSSLLRRIFWANKLDLALDAVLTLVSVVLNYASPFFLKRILDGLTNRSPRAMSQAYAYALLAFLATALKAISDLLHLWHSRRCAVRLKAELTAAVYDKALRRKDASGVVAAKPEDEAAEGDKKDTKDKGKGKEKKEEKKTNADSGKIVNLMAGDANRISNVVAGLYFIYSAPFEIIVASLFLYNILGWAAFAGVVVLIIAVPLNSFVSKRSIAITQDLLKARDKRISVMTELIGAITFIKFFAWGQQWKQRAAEARAAEMKQMIRSLINGIFFSMLWALAPLLVTLVSFFCYIVIMKRDLTVSVAFTAISLFSMLRLPLNVIPTFVVFILQAHVSVKRIEDFLGEDEVPDWVCSLKRSTDPFLGKSKIGFEGAMLQWNSGKQSESVPGSSESTSGSDATLTPSSDPAPRFQLSNLTVHFPLGKLSIITGPTGSGKTAMLTALLGEMELIHGKSFLPKYPEQVDSKGLRNSIAYASQTAWLQQKSIRDNILFGEKMDEARYEEVLEACALNPDLDMLEDGDGTEIGAKGVSLSGGQKARVALARAVYSYTQHILLDDPLAAVDSHTAKHLVDKCLNGPILAGRTILLVSHHVELLLPSAKYLVRILDGRIDAQGTPDDLRAKGELEGLVALEEAEVNKQEAAVVNEDADEEVQAVEGQGQNGVNGDEQDGQAGKGKRERKKGPGKKFVQDEERPVGNVKWETYKLYIVAATYTTWAWSVVVLVLSQVFAVGERFWLKVWGEAYTVQGQNLLSVIQPHVHLSALGHDYHHVSTYQHVLHAGAAMNETLSTGVAATSVLPEVQLPSADDNPGFYLAVYAAVVLGTAFMGLFSNAIGSWGQYRAAVNLHNKLLDKVMNGTIRFFNVTPVGRILNRFSKDVETIDTSLNSGLRTVIVYVASLFGAIAVVAFIVPWFLIPAAVISWMYWQYSVLYLRVGRSLRRLEATSRSPIFSGFAEVLDGIISVRAFSAESRFMATLCKQVDKTHSPHYLFWCMNRWLLLRFDLLGSVSVLLTTLFALSGAIPAGSAGMAILSAQSFVSACYWVSRFWGTLEMDFNSVERVQEYLSIPQEPPAVIPSNRPPTHWPSADAGEKFIDVQDLEVKYAPDLPTVFKGSFTVKSGEKIGLIGRTGSGKSTLAQAFLRFCEPFGGRVMIDGIDITSIGVDDLRGAITYIPQDAVLFSGTVRENLDPFNEHTDAALLDALSRVNLGDSPAPSAGPSRQPSSRRLAEISAEHASLTVDRPSSSASSFKKSSITLSTEVSAGGSNFSQGQRQLIAMARALLRRSNLIIMDEATASVDFATDEAIQYAIRKEFGRSTLLTIAHRLSSVIDYDRLLVLSDGRVAEYDTPINLLRKDDSLFKNLCEKSGKYRELYKAAEKKEKGDLLVDVTQD